EIDHLVDEVFFKQAEQDSNIRAVRDLLTKRVPDVNAVLTTYRNVLRGKNVPDEERSPVISRLKLSGVVLRDAKGMLSSRNQVYRKAFDEQWIEENLLVDWKKRFQYALVLLLVALPLITVPLSIFAWSQRNLALESAAREREAAAQERKARLEAEKQSEEAKNQRRIALEQSRIAESARYAEEKQRLDAVAQRNIAVEAKNEAEMQKIIAEKAADKARKAEEAEKSANMALRVANDQIKMEKVAAETQKR